MALPGRPQTFALENCRDLCNKLQREIDSFKAAPTDTQARADLAFNIVVTAWQLCDWVYADLTPAQKTKLGINSLADMQARARQCRSLHLCRQAATASKHWEVKNHPDPSVSAIVTVKPITGSGDPHSPINWSFYFVDDKNVTLAEQVFEEALEFWTQFIYQNGIAK